MSGQVEVVLESVLSRDVALVVVVAGGIVAVVHAVEDEVEVAASVPVRSQGKERAVVLQVARVPVSLVVDVG